MFERGDVLRHLPWRWVVPRVLLRYLAWNNLHVFTFDECFPALALFLLNSLLKLIFAHVLPHFLARCSHYFEEFWVFFSLQNRKRPALFSFSTHVPLLSHFFPRHHLRHLVSNCELQALSSARFSVGWYDVRSVSQYCMKVMCEGDCMLRISVY